MDDLIGEFITETTESLALLDLELVNLEKNPQDSAILGTIFRVMHTIKGTCGFLSLPRLESVAHASENVLGKIRDKKLEATPDAISLVLESLDNIKALIDHLSNEGTEQPGDDSALIGRLNRLAESGTTKGTAAPAKAAPVSADNPFPHFRGEDDPVLKAAMDKILAEQAVPKEVEKPKAKAAPVAKATVEAPLLESKDAAAATSIRVNLDVLETLMQSVSELVLTRNQLMQIVRVKEDKDFMTPLQQLSHITTELQDSVMKTRMQPIGNAWAKFPRLIRDLSLELGKKIDLKMFGAETELDRQLLEVVKDPLIHMVRNSCDHGLETPIERVTAGKPETGTITLSAYHEGGHIIIEIKDDGRGINIEKVKQKALSSGLASEAALEAMSEKQIVQFIFHAGFSTVEKVTSVSGRGVGMDVVRNNIEKIGGAIELDSRWGHGSRISIKIPLTLAIISVLLVEVSGQKFAIPQLNVLELVRVAPGTELSIETISGSPVMRLRNKLLSLAVLSSVLGIPTDMSELLTKEMYVAICKVGGYDFGIVVEQFYDTEEIVVKPVASILKNISVYAGNTILGDGSVIMILDPGGVARSIGNIEISSHNVVTETRKTLSSAEALVGFLLFTTGKGAPKSVPLELVSRLEEIAVSSIEIAGDRPVVQYHGELMRLIMLDDDFTLPASGKVDVVVFSYDRKIIGLVVKEIIDIVYTPFAIKLTSKDSQNKGYLGSMVIAGKSTDIVDVAQLLSDIIDTPAPAEPSVSKAKAAMCSVLLIEDSPFFRELTVPFLSAAGYKITIAESAEEALSILNKHNGKFDMIVTDLEMPGMDGFEFASNCRSTPLTRHIPIIACAASVNADVMQRSKTAGMNECILKTDRTGLLDSVSRWLVGEIPQVRH